MLELKNATFFYEENHLLLDHVNVSFPSHGLIMIEGESGSGKSTLLSLLHHEKGLKEGEILFHQCPFSTMSAKEVMDYRLFSCGVVYQDYGLFPHQSIEENLNMLMEIVGVKKDIPSLLKKVGLKKDSKTSVDVLSGGEKQRVAIARSMILSSPILLFDEPTSSLDDQNAFEIMSLLKDQAKERLIIIVTHDQRMIEKYSDFHFHMEKGKLICIKKKKIEEKRPPQFSFKRKKFSYKKYIKNRLLHKKKRTILMVSFLSISGFIGSFSAVLIENMKKEITNSFLHVAKGKEIQMEVKEGKTLDDRYSLSKEEIQTLEKENSNMRFTYYYEEDFTYAFSSRNEFRLSSLKGYPLLRGFKMETLNHFRLLDEVTSYPFISSLANDEIVIGITEKGLNELCTQLGIMVSYESLGNYLKRNPLPLVIRVKNIDWDYEDEQLLLIKGVAEANAPTIYHSSPYFNEYVLEERMRFRSTLSWYEEVEHPWIFHKRSVLNVKERIENIASSYFQHFLYDELEENRYLISKNEKSYVSLYDVNRILAMDKEFIGALEGSEQGYQIFSQTILHGLPGILMIDKDQESLYQKEEQWMKENYRDNQLLFHSVLYPSEQTFSLFPIQDGIYISSSLAKKRGWKKGDIIYYLYSYQDKTYEGEWEITGIQKERSDVLFLSNSQLKELFLVHHITTSSYLKATSVLFFIKNASKVETLLETLSKLYPEYLFSSPSYDFYCRFNHTMSSIQKGLSIFAIWMMIFSSFLFSIIHALFLYECKKDIKRMEALGFDTKVKEKLSFFFHFIFFILATFISFLYLLTIGLLSQSEKLKGILNFSFTIDVTSLFTFFYFSILLYLVTFFITFVQEKKKIKKLS